MIQLLTIMFSSYSFVCFRQHTLHQALSLVKRTMSQDSRDQEIWILVLVLQLTSYETLIICVTQGTIKVFKIWLGMMEVSKAHGRKKWGCCRRREEANYVARGQDWQSRHLGSRPALPLCFCIPLKREKKIIHNKHLICYRPSFIPYTNLVR